ncbi:MAG: hypothetical protein M1828_007020 [Chrysothrix sp. TS-e1954]|nr:MAG: hypothetical protein M1828_007020 [Chrysothrix sp. TS-e1954]
MDMMENRRTRDMQPIFQRMVRPQEPTLPGGVPTKRNLDLLNTGTIDVPAIPTLPAPVASPLRDRSIVPKRSSSADTELRKVKLRRVDLDFRNVTLVNSSPWQGGKRLGVLTQDSSQYTIWTPNKSYLDMLLFKASNDEVQAKVELETLSTLSHVNIVKLRSAYRWENQIYLGLEYCRYTLQELLHVHLPFEEVQIRLVAQTVFDAVAYLHQNKIAHNAITLHAIRVSSKAQFVLADFEQSCSGDGPDGSREDLEALAAVLVQCMEGCAREPASSLTDYLAHMREQRDSKQVFGISNAARWSGSTELVDFVEHLLDRSRSAQGKLEKPVSGFR